MDSPENQPAVEASEWPLPLMLDELWLRSHRKLVHRLEASSLWPERRAQQRYMSDQRHVGTSLQERILLDVLGAIDFSILQSESAFGVHGGRLRRRTPLVLAFGYGLGKGLYDLVAGDDALREPIGELCAIFNLGVSTFDTVIDASEELSQLLITVLDERHVRDGAAIPSLLRDVASVADAEPEIRITLKLVSSFFDRLRHIVQQVGPPDGPIARRIVSSLVLAYQSEVESTELVERSPPEWISVSRAKSTLPFSIIADIVLLGTNRGSSSMSAAYKDLAGHIETMFWLVDDIVDLISDLQTGALNSLLVACGRAPLVTAVVDNDYAALSSMLDSAVVEDTVDRVAADLAAAAKLVPQINPNCSTDELIDLLRCYLRDWIE